MNSQEQPQLGDETWTPCSYDAVMLAVLRADWTRRRLNDRGHPRLIAHPDLLDPAQNDARRALLLGLTGSVWPSVPKDTAWFEVRHLGMHHFGALRHIHHLNWSSYSRSKTNEVLEIANLRPERLRSHAVPATWQPVLWGHERAGPFTILDGNRRIAALALAPKPYGDLKLVAYVGLSGAPGVWHRPDAQWQPAQATQGIIP